MIEYLLWDVDGTLLDFRAAESAAIKRLFAEFSLGECTDETVRRYSAINDVYWRRLERNEISKPRALTERFERFFGEIGVPVSLAEEFNRRYQMRLGDTVAYLDDSLNVVRSLRGVVRQYAVSNGTTAAQNKKLKLSGLGELMDGVFLSEAVGAEKPNKAFFDAVLRGIGAERTDEVMIVGDSLTSDILGGINAGIRTCWYNPGGAETPEGFRIDHVIADLREVAGILRPPEEKSKKADPGSGKTPHARRERSRRE